jgi:hypothetical protein
LCRSAFIVSVDAATKVSEFFVSGEKEIRLPAPKTEAEVWDLYERGPRIFLFPVSSLEK